MILGKLSVILASVLISVWDARGNYFEKLPGNDISNKTWIVKYEIISQNSNNTLFCSLEIGSDKCLDFPNCCCSYLRCRDDKNYSLNAEEDEVEFVEGYDIDAELEALTMRNIMAHVLPLCILLFGISVGLGLYYLASRAIVPVSNNISSSVKP